METCKLCLKEKPLMKSHLLPAALYAGKKKEYEMATAAGTFMTRTQVKQPLLCNECEQLFSDNGESHVLHAIAPKSRKRFPLHDRMRVAYAREADATSSRFHGPDFNLDMDKFAYFAVSVVWRIAATRWVMPNGVLTEEHNLGTFQENMRRYLLGETPLPSDMAVIVIVCSDTVSRTRFFAPGSFIEGNCINFRFLARGVTFRVMMGYQMLPYLREQSCTMPLKNIWYADCEKRTLERNIVPQSR
jgi:hypothetical protein